MAQILVVEDDRSFAEALACAIRLDGHEVTVARNAEEGVEAGLTLHPDVMIADWELGSDLHGGNVCGLVKAASPSTKTILMTGYLNEVAEIRNWSAFAETLLEKPFHKETILGAIHRAISENAYDIDNNATISQ